MSRNIDEFLNPSDHLLIDHTGIPGVGSGGGDTVPIGGIIPFGGPVSSIPAGYLPCDGSEYGRTGGDPNPQPALFAVIGTSWGVGDGSTTFNVPDSRGRGFIGLNDGTLPNGADGARTPRALGDEGGDETHVLSVGEMPSHSHTTSTNMSSTAGTDTTRVAAGTLPDLGVSLSGINSTGGGGAHNNMQPFAVAPFIIKASNPAGIPEGNPYLYGRGLLGDLTVTTGMVMETEGRQEYENVTIETGAALAVTALRKLTLLCTGSLTIQGTGALHADGRGCPGTPGQPGGNAGADTAAQDGLDGANVGNSDTFLLISEGGAAGGGGSGSTPGAVAPQTTGAGGKGGDATNRFSDYVSTIGGAAGGLGGAAVGPTTSNVAGQNAGSAAAPRLLGALARARILDELRSRSFPGLMGGGGPGGGSGGGGAGPSTDGNPGGTAGAAGGQTGADLGHGTAGGPGASFGFFINESGAGGGSGGGGAGGGALEVRVQGAVTLDALSRISANGGDGGAGGDGGNGAGAGGGAGGGGPGGGGYVLLIFGGVGVNVDLSHVLAAAGSAASGGAPGAGQTSNPGGAGTGSQAAEPGYALILSLA